MGVYSPLKIALYLLTGKACFPYYFIIVYLQFVLLLYPISKLALSKYRYIGWLLSPLYLLLVVYAPIIFGFSYGEIIRFCLGTSFWGWFVFFYLGLMFGNGLVSINLKISTIILLLICSLGFQIAEAYGLYSIGEVKLCGTQQKVTAYITSIITCLLCHNLVRKEKNGYSTESGLRLMISIGNCSFGIYLIHILIRDIAKNVAEPLATSIWLFGLTLTASYLIVLAGRKYLPKRINQYIGF